MTDFNTITKIIQERRSVFPPMYQDKLITDDIIKALLENANWAPTHRKTEPWRFRVIKEEKLKELSVILGNHYKSKTAEEDFSEVKFNKKTKKPLKSGAVLAICMKRDPNESVPEWEEIAATACAVQNIWLSCTALGIGSYWSSPFESEEMHAFLELEHGERFLGLFYMGYKKDAIYTSERNHIDTKVKWL